MPEIPQGLGRQCEDSIKDLEGQVLGSDPELLQARELTILIILTRSYHYLITVYIYPQMHALTYGQAQRKLRKDARDDTEMPTPRAKGKKAKAKAKAKCKVKAKKEVKGMRNERAKDEHCDSDAIALEDEDEAGKNEMRAEPKKTKKKKAAQKASQVPVLDETPCKNVQRRLSFEDLGIGDSADEDCDEDRNSCKP